MSTCGSPLGSRLHPWSAGLARSRPSFPAEATTETSRSPAYSTARRTALHDRPLRWVGRAERGRPGAERAVDRIAVVRDVNAVFRRPDERADDRVGEEEVARAAVDARLDDRQLDFRRDADDPLAVCLGRDDPGHVRAVARVVVPGRGILVRRTAHAGDAAPGVDVVVQVRMARVDAGVDHSDEHPWAPARDRVGLGCLDTPRIPLQGGERVVIDDRPVRQVLVVPPQPQPDGVATTLPTGATPSTRRFRSSAAAKPGSSDSAMTTSICG